MIKVFFNFFLTTFRLLIDEINGDNTIKKLKQINNLEDRKSTIGPENDNIFDENF